MNQKSERSAIIKSSVISKVQLICGIILLILFGLPTVFGFREMYAQLQAGGMVFLMAMTACGALLVILGGRRAKLIRTYKLYVQRMLADPTRSVELLALSTNTPMPAVRKNLDKMIHIGYFRNAYIDNGRNCLVFAQQPLQSAYEATAASGQGIPQQPIYVSVACRGCGAPNRIVKGAVGECEFCGSPIK